MTTSQQRTTILNEITFRCVEHVPRGGVGVAGPTAKLASAAIRTSAVMLDDHRAAVFFESLMVALTLKKGVFTHVSIDN